MLKSIGEFILYRLMGWKIEGELPNLQKYIIIGGPHTTNWDFILALMTGWVKELNLTILGKKELFAFPIGWIFRALGVVPVIRKKSQNQVEAIAEMFRNRPHMIIGMAPEGTRKKVAKLKSGFYHMGRLGGVPVVAIGCDYPTKTLIISQPFYATEDTEKDLEGFHAFFRKITPKYPENGID